MHTAEDRMQAACLAIALPARPNESHRERRFEITLDRGRTYRLVVPDADRRQTIVNRLEASGTAAIVPASGRLIANLKVWENIVLPLAYRGATSIDELEACATALFAELGYPPDRIRALAGCLPDQISPMERRLAAFVRAMLAEPEVMVLDSVADGLTRGESARALALGALFLRRFPFRTVVHIEPEAADSADWIEV